MQFSGDFVNERGNIRRLGPLPQFSDLEVIALNLATESEGIDSENWLFGHKLEDCKSRISNLISSQQFNDRRKTTGSLCEENRKRLAGRIDGGEDYFCINSRPVEVCRPARGRRCKMGRTSFEKAPDFGYCAS